MDGGACGNCSVYSTTFPKQMFTHMSHNIDVRQSHDTNNWELHPINTQHQRQEHKVRVTPGLAHFIKSTLQVPGLEGGPAL